jgi:F-type H+-transporting ATPase subunit delta
MTMRASAARYARALLDVATAESIAERAEQDLSTFSDLLDQYPELQRVLTNPAVPVGRKRAALQDLLPRLNLSTPVTKLLLMLVDRDRLVLFPDLLAVYRERLRELQQIVQAEVTTAEPLPSDAEAQLQQRLARATGKTVTMTTKVDPSIIGGVVARIGSVVYDGSVATQLQTIKQRLIQQA